MPNTLRLTPANGHDAEAGRELTDFVERGQRSDAGGLLPMRQVCSWAAPLAAAMENAEGVLQQIIRPELGQPDLALGSQTLWLCVGCQTCAARCPCNVELPRIMERCPGCGPKPTARGHAA